MKTVLKSLLGVLVIAGGLGYLFRDALWDGAQRVITRDMYVAADVDTFDPGIALGQQFPDIRALYQGGEIRTVERFYGDRGMLFIANRSASW